jgi:hypothetical protein
MSGRAVLLVALASCSPDVPVGADLPPPEEKDCELVTVPSVACPEAPWGAQRSFASVDSLEQRLAGRWAFCGGERRYTGRGPMKGFSQGAGVEFWSEQGQLRWAFLRGPPPALVRSSDPAGSGTARLVLENGRGHAVLRAGDGYEAVWHADFFEGQPVLQNGAFDVWNFVPVN